MQYKWVVLSNTTLGILVASIDINIVIIALPAIFRGINIDPFNSFQYLLWLVFGYDIVTATLLVTFGRISDMFGRVRLYNLGFAIYTVGSLMLYLTSGTGDSGALERISFRFIQGIGGAFLFSNGAASGMRSTLQNTGSTVGLSILFTIVLVALSGSLGHGMSIAAANAGAAQLGSLLETIPPTGALFAAFLGYNPMGVMLKQLPQAVTSSLTAQSISVLTSTTWFPTAIAPSFMSALDVAFYFNAGLAVVAAAASALRGKRFVYSAKQKTHSIEVPAPTKISLTSSPFEKVKLNSATNAKNGDSTMRPRRF